MKIRRPLNGAPFVHAHHHVIDSDFTMRHFLTNAERATLDAYYLAQAGLSFTLNHDLEGAITCRFAGPPQYRPTPYYDTLDTLVPLAQVDENEPTLAAPYGSAYPTLPHLEGSRFDRFEGDAVDVSPSGLAYVNQVYSTFAGRFLLRHQATAAERATLEEHYGDNTSYDFTYTCPFFNDEAWTCVWGAKPEFSEIDPTGNFWIAQVLLVGISQP